MKKNKRIIFATIAALSLAAPMAAVFNFDNVQTVSANHQGTKVWLQYGTLKYALKGPSGRVYPAGTKVVRELSDDAKPPISLPARPFYLTLLIGGLPGMQTLQDEGGGEIAQAYVNYEDWHEIDYPSDDVVLVQNTEDYTDLASSDFHPVDSSNPDVPVANLDALEKAYADLTRIAGKSSVVGQDREKIYRFTDRYNAAKAMGATQESVDALTKEINDAVANYKKTGHLVSGNSNSGNSSSSSNSSNSNSGSTTVTPAKRKSKSRFVKLRKASYQYTYKGKRVSKKKLKKGAIVKINGKTYRIKKKTFYRIGKNRYIRKVNVAKN
ncbi:SLAP domain-containing protein [Lactobacillus helsingborgensis]|uniref:SLAP domain-containing protein n=1 Tax=Lactobacillus helsingborgensis TaxID=1218494 RepID=UPI002263B8F7|nr:SLAP domain-containing protein [Lactobacillus helsingborgensis]UZX32176.1 SLAP domain-containing protein [Lactobacillus helsingborgensis]